MTIKSIDDCYRHFRFDRLKTNEVLTLNIATIRSLIRMTWNFAVAAERARAKAEAKNTPTDRRP